MKTTSLVSPPMPCPSLTAFAEPSMPRKLHENRIFTVHFNGRYHYLEFAVPAGAILIPRFDNGDLLLVRLQRAPAFGLSLELPRGGIERGESLERGALRELREETGYRALPADMTYLGKVGADTATINGANEVYLVDLPKGALPGSFDTHEITETVRVSLEELRILVTTDEITCGQTLAALLKLFARS